MTDNTLNKQDVAQMRKLFWQKVEGKISHEQVMEELEKIAGKQGNLIKNEVSMQVSE